MADRTPDVKTYIHYVNSHINLPATPSELIVAPYFDPELFTHYQLRHFMWVFVWPRRFLMTLTALYQWNLWGAQASAETLSLAGHFSLTPSVHDLVCDVPIDVILDPVVKHNIIISYQGADLWRQSAARHYQVELQLLPNELRLHPFRVHRR